MAYWLIKSEPGSWSWDDQMAAGTTHWDGVRNAQALNNMRKMKKGDRAFFYHSGAQRAIVGLTEIVREFYDDPDDPKSGLVDVKMLKPVKQAVRLSDIKADPALAHIALVRQSRLSVMPIDDAAAKILRHMAGL